MYQVLSRENALGQPSSGKPTNRVRNGNRNWLRPAVSGLALLLTFLLVTAGVYVASVDRALGEHLNRQPNLMPTVEGGAKRPAKASEKALNFVLIGTDKRSSTSNGVPHADALMVLHLAADRQSADLISIPGDTKVVLPKRGKNTIKNAYALGGAKLTVQTLEELLGTRMDHVAMIDYNSFVNLVQELDGVAVVNKHASSSAGYTYPAGRIDLNGEKALAYVRDISVPAGDQDRAERLHSVMKAILTEGLARNADSPRKFVSFTSKLAENVTVDDGLTQSELRRILLSLRLTEDDIETLQAPVHDTSTTDRTGQVNQNKLKELADALRTDTMDTYEG